jgi:hypothetical protein
MKAQETLEEAAENYAKQFDWAEDSSPCVDFKEGAKWQAERSYSEEEVILLLQKYRVALSAGETPNLGDTTSNWFKQFKKK